MVVRSAADGEHLYIGDHYELHNGLATSYYPFGGRRVALREGTAVSYLFADHLGSTRVVDTGADTPAQQYTPWGEIVASWANTLPTEYTYTGQREASATGGLRLLDYGARHYAPWLGRFLQPDPLVPEPGNPQSLNRYAYVLNNPLRYTDPSGRAICEDADCTRVVHPVSGELIRIRPPQIDWASIPPVVRLIYNEMLTHARGGTVAQLRAWNTQCLSCRAPAYSQVQYTAAIADAEARVLAAGLFAWKIRQGGEWDPKPFLVKELRKTKKDPYWSQLREGGPEYYYDVWGNIEYGYLGTAAAFSEDALLEGAGAEQIVSSIGYAISRRDPGLLPRRAPGIGGLRAWDDPADQTGTQIGIDLWNTYNLTLTPMDIIQAVERTPGLTLR